MTEEFMYLRHGQPIPEGWELVADFDDCHHGRYSQGIVRRKRTRFDRMRDQIRSRFSRTLSWLGGVRNGEDGGRATEGLSGPSSGSSHGT